jgi:hypothetical protein
LRQGNPGRKPDRKPILLNSAFLDNARERTLYRLEAGRFASRLKARLKGRGEIPTDRRHPIGRADRIDVLRTQLSEMRRPQGRPEVVEAGPGGHAAGADGVGGEVRLPNAPWDRAAVGSESPSCQGQPDGTVLRADGDSGFPEGGCVFRWALLHD